MILHKAVIIKSQRYEKFKQVERNAKLIRTTKQKKQQWRGNRVHAIAALLGDINFLIQGSLRLL